jgi:hypothetical protein
VVCKMLRPGLCRGGGKAADAGDEDVEVEHGELGPVVECWVESEF